MKVYACMAIDEYGEEWLTKATIDRHKAWQISRDYIEEMLQRVSGDAKGIEDALNEWNAEFENYIPRGMNAECDYMVVRVIPVDED